MKLNPLQRWAYKLGVPLKILNVFAQEYYGYPIPDANGRYPDWWYIEQRVPTSFRDCEVPEEVLKKDRKKSGWESKVPRVYVRVKQGKVVEVLSNSAIPSEPNFSQHRTSPPVGYPQTVAPPERYEVRYRDRAENVATDEIVPRVIGTRREDRGPVLNRSTSAPVFSREDDIMSFIREERLPTRRPAVVTGMLNPGPLFHTDSDTDPAFLPPQRSATAPFPRPSNDHSVPSLRMPSGPPLPSNPRPVRHQRTSTSVTNDTVLGYYYTSAADVNTAPYNSYRQRQERQYRPMDRVKEDTISEWSGYAHDDDEAWEDEEMVGRKADYRRDAAERLREYRRES